VDLACKWCHTELLTSFCKNNGSHPVVYHASGNVDYTYHFGMRKFSTIDHILISGTLYEKAVIHVEVQHSVDDMPDHDPHVVRLCLQMSFVSCASKIHMPYVAWAKASPKDIYNYHSTLLNMINNTDIHNDTLFCNNLQCKDPNLVNAIHIYANDITEACIAAARLVVPLTCSQQQNRRIPGWSEQDQHLRTSHCFGKEYGMNVGTHIHVTWLTVCDALQLHT